MLCLKTSSYDLNVRHETGAYTLHISTVQVITEM